jgi:spore germination protein GerM
VTPPKRLASATRRAVAIYAGLAAAAVLAAWMAFLIVSRLGPGGSNSSADVAPSNESDAGVPVRVTLYYVAEDGMELVGFEREMPSRARLVDRARAITEQQLSEAPLPLASPFPEGTRLRALYLRDGDAYVDLSREVTVAHAGGSLEEIFTVYALVNALTSNLPEIRAVQILIEGQEVDTLAGHVDLRHPLEQNMKWVSQPGDDEPPAAGG